MLMHQYQYPSYGLQETFLGGKKWNAIDIKLDRRLTQILQELHVVFCSRALQWSPKGAHATPPIFATRMRSDTSMAMQLSYL